MHQYIKITLFIFLSSVYTIFAQDKDTIGTETVNVTKAYKPTVSDAFKVKTVPNLNDSVVLQRQRINYSIFSTPVASTFTPAKGKASAVDKVKPAKIYNSYASLGLGNYNNALADFYTSRALNRDERLDIGFNHHSSRGKVEGVALKNTFYNTKAIASYSKKDRDVNWGANLELQHQLYNWYGIVDGVVPQTVIDGIDATQNYFNVELGGNIEIENSFLKGGNILLRRFWDATKSGENRVVLTPVIEVPVADELITAKIKIDYVGGSFKNAIVQNQINSPSINYSQFQFGVTPSILVLRDNLTVNAGLTLAYGLDAENSEGEFFIYPNITASYRLLNDVVIVYGGLEGELKQNSYQNFVDENPYISPTLIIAPTDKQYSLHAGFKGQLLPNLSYNIKASYTGEKNKALFKLNPRNLFRTDDKGYYYGNSFDVIYDGVQTLGIFGELNVDVNRNFSLGLNVEAYDYTLETDNPAWNLPGVRASVFMDYQIGEKWFAGANLFYVGERQDQSSLVEQNVLPENFPSTTVMLEGYFDANVHLGYRYNEQLSFFAKANNIANNNYMRWANYPVQGFQILAGATYKFDF